MSQSLNASMRIIKSSLPWLKVSNSVFHRRLEYLSALKSKVINSSYTSFSLTSENLFFLSVILLKKSKYFFNKMGDFDPKDKDVNELNAPDF